MQLQAGVQTLPISFLHSQAFLVLSDNAGEELAKACVWLLPCQIHFNW